jgi:hypothetical protein
MQSVTRIIAPLYASYFYAIGKPLPYATGAVFMILCVISLVISLPILKSHKAEEKVLP